jgi:hypothetical protein
MMKMKLSLLILTCLQLAVNAQVYENKIYDARVQTVLFNKAGTEDRYPIISLNSQEVLKLSFDIFGNQSENLQYTFIHCDANWNPTKLNQNEYLQGMTFDNITDFGFSTNTYVKYVHYNIFIPNDNMKPRIAGNYVVKVFRNFDEEDLLFTRRMMVLNSSAPIEGLARPASLAEYRFTKQEVSFAVGINPTQIVNPMQDVKVVIMQNSRWDNAITGLTPQFMSNNKLDYSYLDKTLFNGGNEFRFFDIRQLRQFSTNVRSKRTDTVVHVILNIEESRGASQYFNYLDYNGKRIVQNKEGINTDLDGDYAYVNFYLSSTMGVPPDAEVYVFGEFTDWRLVPEYKMYFNKSRQRYDLEVPLKQGRYEYCYAIKNEKGVADETSLEGNHFQTENEYVVLVYTKNLQFHYDELIGVRKFSTTAP